PYAFVGCDLLVRIIGLTENKRNSHKHYYKLGCGILEIKYLEPISLYNLLR
ncbi:5999_t:CDS:1, partial [Funneliformis geosporum]